MKRTLSLAIFMLGLVATRPVRAQDLAPVIDHQPTTKAVRDQPVEIRAKINSVSGKAIYQPTVYVRVAGISGYSRIQMQAVTGTKDVFFATIPANLASNDFDYYVEAFDEDGNGPGRSGTPESPLHVSVGNVTATGPNPNAGPGLLEGEKLKFAGQEDPRQMNNGQKRIIAGAILGGSGILLLIVGAIESVVAAGNYNSGDSVDGDFNTGVEIIAVVAGIALTATGIGVLISGIILHKKWQDAMEKAGLQVTTFVEPHSHAPGLAVSLRF